MKKTNPNTLPILRMFARTENNDKTSAQKNTFNPYRTVGILSNDENARPIIRMPHARPYLSLIEAGDESELNNGRSIISVKPPVITFISKPISARDAQKMKAKALAKALAKTRAKQHRAKGLGMRVAKFAAVNVVAWGLMIGVSMAFSAPPSPVKAPQPVVTASASVDSLQVGKTLFAYRTSTLRRTNYAAKR